MAAHKVKCFYCGQIFDANKEPFEKPRANRYAHKTCHEQALINKSQEEKDYDALIEYIKHLFGEVPDRVWGQLKEFREEKDEQGNHKYTYSGILKTLIWWYEVRHGDLEKAHNGIAIVHSVYQQALQYYFALYLAKIANEDKDVLKMTSKSIEFIIEPPVAKICPPRLFNLNEGDELDEQE